MLETLLWPLMAIMRLMLIFFNHILDSFGFAIIGLSLIVRILTIPIADYAGRSDKKNRKLLEKINAEKEDIQAHYTGRERFDKIEELYKRNNYHPIKNVLSLVPLLLQIPFLLAALYLLTGFPPLAGQSFFIIHDLQTPDNLLLPETLGINLLPILIALIALFEFTISLPQPKADQYRFFLITGIITALIYKMPSGVCLYWLTSNIFSLLRKMKERFVLRGQPHKNFV